MGFGARRRLAFAAAVGLGFGLGLVTTREARAGEVGYRSVEGCPSRADVDARLRASGTRDVHIDIARSHAGYRGELLVGDGESRLTRTVEAQTCGAVVDALALVVALDREEPATVDDVEPPPADPEPAMAGQPAVPGSPGRDSATGATGRPEDGSRVVGAFGSTFMTTSFADGEMLFGTSLFAEVAAPRGVAGLSWLKPSARASFLRTSSTSWTDVGGVSPDFTVTGGAVDVCALGLWNDETLGLSACSRTEVGSLAVLAAGDDASSQSRRWLATGAVGRARFVFTTRGRVRPLLEVSGGVLVPLVRDRFHFPGHDAIVASGSLWTAAIGGGIELR